MVGCCITVVTADVVQGSVINKVQNAYILMGTGEVRARLYGVRYCKVIFLYSESDFSLLRNVQTGTGIQPASYSMGTRFPSRG